MSQTPSFGQFFETHFQSTVTPTCLFDLKTHGLSFKIGNVHREQQLPFNQQLFQMQFGSTLFGFHKGLTLSPQSEDPVEEIKNVFKNVRAVAGFTKRTNHGDYGVGLVVPLTAIDMADKNINYKDFGVYLSVHKDNSTVDMQAMKNGFIMNVVRQVHPDVYVGASYSNLIDTNGRYLCGFVSRIPSQLTSNPTFWDAIRNNSKLLVGLNGYQMNEKNKITLVGQCSVPIETSIGTTTITTGASLVLNRTTYNESTLTLSGRHDVCNSGFSLVGSMDTKPAATKSFSSAMFGIEYNKLGFSMIKNVGVGLYMEAQYNNHQPSYNPKVGISLKF
jgi:hypothetical protein